MSLLALGLIALDLLISDSAKAALAYVTIAGLAGTAVLVVLISRTPGVSFYDTLTVDPLSTLFQLLVLGAAAVVTLSSVDYLRRRSQYQGEFYALLVFATLGAVFLAGGNELITIYVAIELTSISQYVMAAFLKGDNKSSEAGIKYLLLGALSSAVLLYGIALLFGATGTTTLPGIRDALAGAPISSVALLGVAFLIAGFGFKMAVVPFQLWIPDVYEGAPT